MQLPHLSTTALLLLPFLSLPTALAQARPEAQPPQVSLPILGPLEPIVNKGLASAHDAWHATAQRKPYPLFNPFIVAPLTWYNWREVLTTREGVPGDRFAGEPFTPWMILVTGGNRTCNGQCGQIDRAFNETVTALKKDPKAPYFAALNCDNQELLCGAWAVVTGTVWHILVPRPRPGASPLPAHPLHIFQLNYTTARKEDITRIHTAAPWRPNPDAQTVEGAVDEEKQTRYEGAMHPFDGWASTSGLVVPMAWTLWGVAKVPPWAMMLLTTMATRRMMSKKMAQQGATAGGAARGGAPAARGGRAGGQKRA